MAIFTKGVPEMKAEKVTYDNTTSEFVADDVQSAIDELSAIFPTGGSEGQVLTKTETGTAWEDAQGGATMVVNITYADGAYSADKTYAEIMANINAGGQPIARYGAWYLRATTASATQIAFGDIAQTNGIGKFNISSSNAVTYSVTYVSPVRYYNKTLGIAEAVSDSTVYTNGYLLTLSNNYIDNFTSVNVEFPNGDYSGNVTWITGNDHKILLYFDQNPNGKSIRVEWYSIVYTAVTIS